MTTQYHMDIQAGVDRGATASHDGHHFPMQTDSLATPADWRLLFDAVIWRMQHQANAPLNTTEQLRETLRDGARALDQLRSSIAVAARAGDPAQQTHHDGSGRDGDQH